MNARREFLKKAMTVVGGATLPSFATATVPVPMKEATPASEPPYAWVCTSNDGIWYSECRRPAGACLRLYRLFVRLDDNVVKWSPYCKNLATREEFTKTGDLYLGFNALCNSAYQYSREEMLGSGRKYPFQVTGFSFPTDKWNEIVIRVELAARCDACVGYDKDGQPIYHPHDSEHQTLDSGTRTATGKHVTHRVWLTHALMHNMCQDWMQKHGATVLHVDHITVPNLPTLSDATNLHNAMTHWEKERWAECPHHVTAYWYSGKNWLRIPCKGKIQGLWTLSPHDVFTELDETVYIRATDVRS